MEIVPNNAQQLFNRGYALLLLQRYAEGLKDFDGVIEVNPAFPYVDYRRGLCLLEAWSAMKKP